MPILADLPKPVPAEVALQDERDATDFARYFAGCETAWVVSLPERTLTLQEGELQRHPRIAAAGHSIAGRLEDHGWTVTRK